MQQEAAIEVTPTSASTSLKSHRSLFVKADEIKKEKKEKKRKLKIIEDPKQQDEESNLNTSYTPEKDCNENTEESNEKISITSSNKKNKTSKTERIKNDKIVKPINGDSSSKRNETAAKIKAAKLDKFRKNQNSTKDIVDIRPCVDEKIKPEKNKLKLTKAERKKLAEIEDLESNNNNENENENDYMKDREDSFSLEYSGDEDSNTKSLIKRRKLAELQISVESNSSTQKAMPPPDDTPRRVFKLKGGKDNPYLHGPLESPLSIEKHVEYPDGFPQASDTPSKLMHLDPPLSKTSSMLTNDSLKFDFDEIINFIPSPKGGILKTPHGGINMFTCTAADSGMFSFPDGGFPKNIEGAAENITSGVSTTVSGSMSSSSATSSGFSCNYNKKPSSSQSSLSRTLSQGQMLPMNGVRPSPRSRTRPLNLPQIDTTMTHPDSTRSIDSFLTLPSPLMADTPTFLGGSGRHDHDEYDDIGDLMDFSVSPRNSDLLLLEDDGTTIMMSNPTPTASSERGSQ